MRCEVFAIRRLRLDADGERAQARLSVLQGCGLGACMSVKEKRSTVESAETARQRELEKLEKEVDDLKLLAGNEDADAELERLRAEVAELRKEFYAHLGPWQRAQIARHPQRPYTLDWVNLMFTDFVELHGGGCFGDD